MDVKDPTIVGKQNGDEEEMQGEEENGDNSEDRCFGTNGDTLPTSCHEKEAAVGKALGGEKDGSGSVR